MLDYKITRPNGVTSRLSQLKIKICILCNTVAGKLIEAPASEIVKKLANDRESRPAADDISTISAWLNWIYVKFQIKFHNERMHLNLQEPPTRLYTPEDTTQVYQAHRAARAVVMKQHIDPSLNSSIFVHRFTPDNLEMFIPRFGISLFQPIIFMSFRGIFICAAISDGGLINKAFSSGLHPFKIPSNLMQVRENVVEFNYAYSRLVDFPQNWVEYDQSNDIYKIIHNTPDLKLFDFSHDERDQLMRLEFGNDFIGDDPSSRWLQNRLKEGKFTFFDRSSRFIWP